MSDGTNNTSTTSSPLGQYGRFIGSVYVIYVRDLNVIRLAPEFEYDRFIEKGDAFQAIADRGTNLISYLVLEEFSVLD